jgi:hypothetical protein
MTNLIYPKTEYVQQENPAIILARRTLKKENVQSYSKSKARCWRCKKTVGKSNLFFKWIKSCHAQRRLCADCIPVKDVPLKTERQCEFCGGNIFNVITSGEVRCATCNKPIKL